MPKLSLKAALNTTKIAVITFLIVIVVILAVIFTLRTIHANQFKTKSENGFQERLFLEMGGIEQYVKIQGEDISNLSLFLHSGPGYTLASLNYYYQPSLLSDFTIVSWDQRGSRRTYYQNPDMNIDNKLSKEQLR